MFSMNAYTYFDRYIYSHISCFLGEFSTIKYLDGLCKNSTEHMKEKYETIKKIHTLKYVPDSIYNIDNIRFMMSCYYGIVELALKYNRCYEHNNSEYVKCANFIASFRGHDVLVSKFAPLIEKHSVTSKIDLHPVYYFAASCGYTDLLEWFRNNVGADLRVRNDNLLVSAVKNGRVEVIKWLLEHGIVDKNQLHLSFVHACSRGHKEIAQLLIDAGAKIHAFYEKSLYMACINAQFDIIEWLLSIDSWNIKTKFSEICSFLSLDVIKILYNAPEPTKKTIDLDDALKCAKKCGRTAICEWLVEQMQ